MEIWLKGRANESATSSVKSTRTVNSSVESASNDHGKARQLDGIKEKEIMRKRVK
jgi:hypothetical protein